MFEVEALFPHTEGDVERQQLGPRAGFLLLALEGIIICISL